MPTIYVLSKIKKFKNIIFFNLKITSFTSRCILYRHVCIMVYPTLSLGEGAMAYFYNVCIYADGHGHTFPHKIDNFEVIF